jgi:DNA/RNA endonuclease YhcR with UshA esterase domain
MNKNFISSLSLFFFAMSLSAQTFDVLKSSNSTNQRFTSLFVAHDGSILAGGAGLYRSYDNGISWQYCGLDSFEIRCAAADSSGRLYIGGGKVSGRKGVYRSDDNGISWQHCVTASDSSKLNIYYYITSLLSVSDEIILAGTDGLGIFRSTDHGNSWSQYTLPGDYAYQSVNSLCQTTDGYLYAGAFANILRSTDQGETWKSKFKTSSYNYVVEDGNYGDVFTFSMANNGHAYLYRTTDRGESWTAFYPELYESGVSFVLEDGKWIQYGPGYYQFLGLPQDIYGRSFIVCSNRNDSIVVMGTNGQIIHSLAVENPNSYSAPMAMTPDGHLLICSDDVHRSANAIVPPAIPSTKISQVIVDADTNFVPDSVGKTATIVGVVNSANYQGNEGTRYTLQDATGGIQLFKSNDIGPILKLGDAVAVTGTIAYERGTTQIIPASLNSDDVKIIESNQALTVTLLTVQQYLENAEKYESQLVKVTGIGKNPNSVAWPDIGSNANMVFWNGWDTMIVHIDKNTNLAGTTEPSYPANITGVVLQTSSSESIHNDGYQLSPNNLIDFESGVPVPPNPHFALTSPTHGALWEVDSTNQQFYFMWHKAIDLNNDKTVYQWLPVGGSAVTTLNGGVDTFLVRTGAQLLAMMGEKDTSILKWSVQTRGSTSEPLVKNVDTFSITLIKGKTLGIETANNVFPTFYSISQNYPNPFNPSTTIQYALPYTSKVVLRIYNTLGQQIAVLVDADQASGWHEKVWNANVSSGLYFYRIDAVSTTDPQKRFTQLKKMLLLK